MIENSFTGDVSQDSPALYGKLKRGFEGAACDRMVEAFRISVLNSGAAEWPVFRARDASFNPKPARIFDILSRECGESRIDILIAAILAPSSLPLHPCSELLPFDSELVIAAEALKFLQCGEAVSADAERIALALLLDELRHLHMTCLDLKWRCRRVREAETLILKAQESEFNARLIVLLNSCCDRLEILFDLHNAA